ncbi:peptidoglycan-binding protein [Paracoccus niistensis]|uniref:Peptidoglycan-binding protein n=1 Tax=Paracoccus niistensis TaxID=632935 RepID=A0ABV6I0T0_9RHOB
MRPLRLALAACVLALAGVAWAEDRAVVIANRAYDHLPDVADVRPEAAMTSLRQQGYRVTEGRDLTADGVRAALRSLLASDADPGARIVVLMGRFARSEGESWFLGREAGRESLSSVGTAGVPLSVVTELMEGGRGPAVLLLGTDARVFDTGEGLWPNLGRVAGPGRVTVIAGYTDGIGRAAAVLARPGASVAQALAQGESLRLVSQGETPGARPVVVPAPAPAQPGEAEAWARAVVTDTAAGWRAYLDKHPQGANAAEARRRLEHAPQRLEDVVQPGPEEMAAWTRAKRTNSAEGYAEFLDKWPQSLFAGAARGRMAELQAPAAPTGSPAAAEAALNLDRAQRARVQRQLRLLTYDTDGIDGSFGPLTRAAIERFQRNAGAEPTGYLTGAQVDLLARQAGERARRLEAEALARQEVEAAADREAWERSQNRGEAGARDYLARYPQGLFAVQAQAVLAEAARMNHGEEDAWARARAEGSAAGWREFLGKYPQSPRAPEARAALDALEGQLARDQAAEARLDLAAPVRQAVQMRLNALGLGAGAPDGNFGPKTRAALRRYQAARNLRPSGYLNQATMVRLLADTLLGQD